MRTKQKITPETIAAYRRAATPPSVADQVAELNRLAWHHEILDLVLDQKTAAVGVERIWHTKAIRLGATPARTAEEAHLKTFYIQGCFDGFVANNAIRSRLELHAALLMGAVGAEEERWAYPAKGKPN